VNADDPGLSERVALSRQLSDLAERCAIESTLWDDPDVVAELTRTGWVLSTLGRAALDADADQAAILTAYTAAGRMTLGQIEGTRRLLDHLKPRTPRPSLDTCAGCGRRVTDYDPDGFEGDNAQRGHFGCGQTPHRVDPCAVCGESDHRTAEHVGPLDHVPDGIGGRE
jgi:hypothetical protein